MASLHILCFNPFNLKNKIMKIEHKKIFRDPSKILKNVSWPINICLKYFMAPTKTLRRPSYIPNVQSLGSNCLKVTILFNFFNYVFFTVCFRFSKMYFLTIRIALIRRQFCLYLILLKLSPATPPCQISG